MSYFEIFMIGVGLSMDAFAVCASNGLVYKNVNRRWSLAMALCFGIFQALMPTAGYFLGSAFEKYITAFDHILALVLLGFIGVKMLIDGIRDKDDGASGLKMTFGILLLQGIATSIDALAVGISFAAMSDVSILPAASLIGCTTFCLCIVALVIGKRFGRLLGAKAQIVGGVILVAIGLKIFIEHTFFGG